MVDYTISILPKSAFEFLNAYPYSYGPQAPWSGWNSSSVYDAGDGKLWQNYSGSTSDNKPWQFTVDYSKLTDVSVSDNDYILQDDTRAGYTTSQTTETASGSVQIEDEYEIKVTDGTTTYTLVAVSEGGSNNIIGYTFQETWPPEGATLTYVADSGVDSEELLASQMTEPCFTRGVLISTPHGAVAIETLHEGDLVLTKDHGPQPIRWIGSSKVSPFRLAKNEKIRPIRICAGALGTGYPQTDLVVSPQHRILVRSKIAEKMFGQAEVLVAAKQLLQLDGVDIASDMTEVEYFHILFDRHEIVLSNGAETESLYTGPEAIKALTAEAREEIFTLFPELKRRDYTPQSARVIVSGRMARKLAVRHIQNRKPLIAA